MHQRDQSEQHPLVTGGQVVQHLTGLFPLLFQIIGNDCREIIVAVLPPLPVGHIGLHTQQAVLHLTNGFVRGHRDDVDAQHHAPIQGGELCDHRILDVAGEFLEKQHPAILVAHDKIVLVKFQRVRTDAVLKVLPPAQILPQVKVEVTLLTGTVEVMEHPEPLHSVQLLAVGIQMV